MVTNKWPIKATSTCIGRNEANDKVAKDCSLVIFLASFTHEVDQ